MKVKRFIELCQFIVDNHSETKEVNEVFGKESYRLAGVDLMHRFEYKDDVISIKSNSLWLVVTILKPKSSKLVNKNAGRRTINDVLIYYKPTKSRDITGRIQLVCNYIENLYRQLLIQKDIDEYSEVWKELAHR